MIYIFRRRTRKQANDNCNICNNRTRRLEYTKRCGSSWKRNRHRYSWKATRTEWKECSRVTTLSWWNPPCSITLCNEIATSRKSAACWTAKVTGLPLRKVISENNRSLFLRFDLIIKKFPSSFFFVFSYSQKNSLFPDMSILCKKVEKFLMKPARKYDSLSRWSNKFTIVYLENIL